MVPPPSFSRVTGQHEPIFTSQYSVSVHNFLSTQSQTAPVSRLLQFATAFTNNGKGRCLMWERGKFIISKHRPT